MSAALMATKRATGDFSPANAGQLRCTSLPERVRNLTLHHDRYTIGGQHRSLVVIQGHQVEKGRLPVLSS
jgi:hypothetical protein